MNVEGVDRNRVTVDSEAPKGEASWESRHKRIPQVGPRLAQPLAVGNAGLQPATLRSPKPGAAPQATIARAFGAPSLAPISAR